jgi:alkaline phosphatase D
VQYDRPGRPYGSPYSVLTRIHERKPDMMLWLGDNVYLREPDWNTRTGIFYRYTHTRSLPELQALLGSTHHYATWDDHDFGPNDSDRSFWNKAATLEAFKLFWANPAYGVHRDNKAAHSGVTGVAEWGDVAFFLLDNRSFRSPNNRQSGDRVMLGEEQLQWLIDALASSRATFKVIAIGGQVLNPVPVFENYSTYPAELTKLLTLIEQEGIKGVVFVSGDRHHTELSKKERAGTYPLYDFTISSITAGSDSRAEKETNFLRVPGTFMGKNNFGIFEFSGPRTDRVLKCTVYDSDGKEVWTQSLRAKDLQ